MLKSGRRRKPDAIKAREGNPGRRPLRAPRKTTKPAAAHPPRCPQWFSKPARQEWRRLAAELHRAGLLSEETKALFVGYCTAWARVQEIEERIANLDPVQLTQINGQGTEIANPLLKMADQAHQTMRRYANDMGLTPQMRQHLLGESTKQAAPVVSEDEAFLRRPRLKVVGDGAKAS